MIWLKEIETDKVNYSKCPHKVHLHTYLVDDKKEFCYGFRNTNTKVVRMFKERTRFATSRRRFIQVKNPMWEQSNG